MARAARPVPVEPTRPGRAVMQASAMKLDPGATAATQFVKATKQSWQERAWTIYDGTGPVKGGARFVENACSLVNIGLGIIPGLGQDPVPLHEAIERGLVSGAPGSPKEDNQAEDPVVSAATVALAEQFTQAMLDGQEAEGALLSGWGVKSFVTGEAYFVAYVDAASNEERWLCLAPEELLPVEGAKPGEPQFKIRRLPRLQGSSKSAQPDLETILPVEAFIMRVWRPHARFHDLSDSNLHACLMECEELAILNASIKAVGTSRIPANILYVANEIKALIEAQEPTSEDGNDEKLHPLLRDLVKHLTTPVRDPGSASSLVPFLMTGPGSVDGVSAKDLVFMIEVSRTIDPQIVERCRYLIEFVANTVELPAERMVGMGQANHWTAWQIDEETYRLYIGPVVDVPIAALTRKYLRDRLIKSNITPKEANAFTYIAEPGALVARPNRSQNAQIAHDAMAISNEALRTSLGFEDGDEPTPEELLIRVILQQHVLPAEVVPYLSALLGVEVPAIEVAEPRGPIIVEPTDPEGGQPEEGESPPPPADNAPNNGEPPANAPGSQREPVTAAARKRTGERLANIDRRLRTRLLAAADAAASRAVERAGARLRTSLSSAKAGSPRAEAKALLVSVPNRHVLSTLGRSRIMELGIDISDLVDQENDDLHDRYDEWVEQGQEEALTVSATALGITSVAALTAMRARQDAARQAGWRVLSNGLMDAVRTSIFDPAPQAVLGEVAAEAVKPGLVRQALAVAGGSSPVVTPTGGVTHASAGGYAGGVATGDDVADLWGSYGQPWSGYVWVYNYDGPSPFPDHEILEGTTFATWEDEALSTSGTESEWIGEFFFPGDHGGCQCDAAPSTG